MYEITTQEREYLLESMHKLLDKYNYSYDDYALNIIIDTWAEEKAPLIEGFQKHPNYIDGKFCIAFDADYDRGIDIQAVRNFKSWLCAIIDPMCDGLPDIVKERKKDYECLPSKLFDVLTAGLISSVLTVRTIDQEAADMINEALPEAHAHAGQKTSRVINRICTFLGYNKHPGWNREFAKYADALSPLTIKRHTVLSINPMDYFTMSFGNSWSSCHTIDKGNQYGYGGCHSSGTISYMLDPSSMVFYTVDKSYDGTDYWTQPKIRRQMFHYGEEKLVQGRLYPQDNDYNSEGYTPFRNIVQAIMALILDMPNLWTLKKGSDAASAYVMSVGTHYKDYRSIDNCTLSRFKGSINENSFTIGADPICIECGEEHYEDGTINCCTSGYYVCADCGHRMDEDDVRWIDGEAYCDDCVHWCDCCEQYTRDDTRYVHSSDSYVCSDCLDYYYYYCDDCGQYYYRDDIRWVESVDKYVCDDCLEDKYSYCDDCEEYYPKDRITYLDGVGRDVCDDCIKEYVKCADCGDWADKTDVVEFNGKYYCEYCVATCEACGQTLPVKQMIIQVDSTYLCQDEECIAHRKVEEN